MDEQEVLQISSLVIEPNNCPLSAPLTIAMQYTLLQPVGRANWELVYEADYTNKRKVIPLHTTPVYDELPPGVLLEFNHAVPEIKTEGMKEKHLLQVGVLKLTLHGNDQTVNVASVNMVTQVAKDPVSGVLVRSIISPLE